MTFDQGNDTTGTFRTQLVGGVDAQGRVRAFAVNEAGQLIAFGGGDSTSSGTGGSGGTSDATQALQQTEIDRLTEIRDKILTEGTDIDGISLPAGGAGARGWLSAIWQVLSATNPAIKSAPIAISAAGDNTIIAPSAPTKSLRICGLYFTAASAVAITLSLLQIKAGV